jgi:hypothetical protein
MSDEQNQELAGLVEQTIRTLFDKGIAAADLAPLVKLHEAVKAPSTPSAAPAAPTAPVMPVAEAAPAVPAAPAAVTGQPATAERNGPYDRDGRRGEVKASEDLMARACAIIDILVQSGQSPDHSAQTITRQLLAVGIQLPECGGDVRAWKRLLNWRNQLIHYTRAGQAWDDYCSFKEELAHIPPDRRLRVAVGERLWDQRQIEYSSADIA